MSGWVPHGAIVACTPALVPMSAGMPGACRYSSTTGGIPVPVSPYRNRKKIMEYLVHMYRYRCLLGCHGIHGNMEYPTPWNSICHGIHGHGTAILPYKLAHRLARDFRRVEARPSELNRSECFIQVSNTQTIFLQSTIARHNDNILESRVQIFENK